MTNKSLNMVQYLGRTFFILDTEENLVKLIQDYTPCPEIGTDLKVTSVDTFTIEELTTLYLDPCIM